MKNRIVYFGTPSFAAEVLRFLLERNVPLAAVVTQPDRPRGRNLQLAPSEVKRTLQEMAPHLPLLQPAKASEEPFLNSLRSLGADLFVVIAYGQILPEKLLAIPPLGCINVHASLLPKYRGAAPIQRAIFHGETETGVCIQKMVKQLDAGPVLSSVKIPIAPDLTAGELEHLLCEASKPLLYDLLLQYEQGIPAAVEQNHSEATYASKIEFAEGEIDWEEGAPSIHNKVRAFSPRPGAWCWLEKGKRRLKILRTTLASQHGAPGQLLSRDGVVACGAGALRLLEVQPEGKRPMNGADWLRGSPQLTHFPV